MKIAPFVFASMLATCLAACASFDMDDAMNSVTHRLGAGLQESLSRESFQRHMPSSTDKHILVIHCAVVDYSSLIHLNPLDFIPSSNPYQKECVWEPFSPLGALITRTAFRYNAQKSRQVAFKVLNTALAYSPSELGWQPTMAVLIFPDKGSRQIYSLSNNAGIPIYVASSDAIEGGSLIHDAISTNLLRLADTTNEDAFPYEAKSIRISPLDDYNDCNLGIFYGWISSSAGIQESSRKEFRRAVSLKWPSLLPEAHGASDVLCFSWKGVCGRLPLRVSYPKGDAFEVALVSVKDGVVYYFKKKDYRQKSYDNLMEPPNRLIFELKRIKEIHSRTSQPSR